MQTFNPDQIIERSEVGVFSAWVLYDEMIQRLGFNAHFVLAREAVRGPFDVQMLSVEQFDVAFFLVDGPNGERAVLMPPQQRRALNEVYLPDFLIDGSGVMISCEDPNSFEVVRFVHP